MAASQRCCNCVSTGKCAHCVCARSNRQCRNCYLSRKGTCENYCSPMESLEAGATCSSDSAPCLIADSSVSLVSEESSGPCLPCFSC